MTDNEAKALAVASARGALLKRLREAASVLQPEFRLHFRGAKLDYANRRLIGAGGYFLQWKTRHRPELPESYENQQTSRGTVELFRHKGV